jgi:hypothetical protein
MPGVSFDGVYATMPSESSDPHGIPPTATSHPEIKDLSTLSRAATQSSKIAHTVHVTIQSVPTSDGRPPTQSPGDAGTVAHERSAAAGGAPPRPSG